MEGPAFDSLARRFGATATRRAGLRGALAAISAAVAGRLGGAEDADAAAGSKRRGTAGAPVAAGPCGAKRRDNRCRKHSDCCTGYCKIGKKKTEGLCRCVPPDMACRAKQTCCNGSVCFQGKCTRNTPSKVCTVCKKGCAHDSVNAAYAAAKPGDTISIAAGTWPAGIRVSKDIRIIACDGADVLLTADGSVTDSYTPSIIVDDANDPTHYTVTLEGLALAGSGKDSDESIIYAVMGTVSFRIQNCDFSDAWCPLNLGDGVHVIQNSTFTRSVYGACPSLSNGSVTVTSSTFTDCDTYGFYALGNFEVANRQKSVFTFTDCEFTGNGNTGLLIYGGIGTADGCTITGNGGSGAEALWGDLVLKDTVVSGNTSDPTYPYGGGVAVKAFMFQGSGDNSSLTILGSTVITGNTAPEGSGIGVLTDGVLTATVTGANSSNVYGNLTGDQCDRSTDDAATWTAVPNCAF